MLTTRRSRKILITMTVGALLAGCGGSSGGGPAAGSGATPVVTPPASTQTLTVSGSVSGLLPGTLVGVTNNGSDLITIDSNGTYQFDVQIPYDGAYDVVIASEPVGQSCTVLNGSGTGITQNVSNADINCAATPTVPVAPSPIPATPLSSAYHTLVWQDDFAQDTAGAPNATLWAMLTGNGTEYGNTGWGNNEAEYYLPSNASVVNGALQIMGKADMTVSGNSCGNSQSGCQFSSARVTSLKSIDLGQPGFLEVQAQIPTAVGSWPAIWLLPGATPGQAFPPSPAQLAAQPTWPSGGEIDLVEYLWLYLSPGDTVVQTSIHLPAGAASPYADSYQYVRTTLTSSASSAFHLYQLSWTAGQIEYAIDNSVIMTCVKVTQTCTPRDPTSPGVPAVSSWPYGTTFSQYYLLMNLAIGGNAGITGSNNALVPANYDQRMVVNYVRYLTP